MPRRILARRFEPRWGVTRPMLNVEATYVGKEVDSYARRSANDLRERHEERNRKRQKAEAELRQLLEALPEQVRLSLRYLIVRDAYHLVELYLTYVRIAFPDLKGKDAAAVIEIPESVPLTFSETLFGQ